MSTIGKLGHNIRLSILYSFCFLFSYLNLFSINLQSTIISYISLGFFYNFSWIFNYLWKTRTYDIIKLKFLFFRSFYKHLNQTTSNQISYYNIAYHIHTYIYHISISLTCQSQPHWGILNDCSFCSVCVCVFYFRSVFVFIVFVFVFLPVFYYIVCLWRWNASGFTANWLESLALHTTFNIWEVRMAYTAYQICYIVFCI